jgi:(heptosyl)LPS beta-1,4-glucosyltransferase
LRMYNDSMKRQTITAIIPARNEEENIERCVKSVLWCDKVQVLWSGTDKTDDMARKLGVEVIEREKSKTPDFEKVQQSINWAIDHSDTDWILRIDADEEVTAGLKDEIMGILETSPPHGVVAFGVPRRQYFWGGFLTGGDWAYDRLTRLFMTGKARYERMVSVHEQFVVNGGIAFLKNPLNHFSHPTLADAVRKFDTYTTLEAQDLKDSTLQAQMKMIFLPVYVFLRWMIWHHGYRDGVRGVVAGAMRGWYDFLLYSKYLKLKKGQ